MYEIIFGEFDQPKGKGNLGRIFTPTFCIPSITKNHLVEILKKKGFPRPERHIDGFLHTEERPQTIICGVWGGYRIIKTDA